MGNPVQPYTKTEILYTLRIASGEASKFFNTIDAEKFFKGENGKWSPAENLKHLTMSINPVSLALRLPKISLRIFGFPSKKSRTYEEVVQRYQDKLAKGAKAGFFFIPGKKKIQQDKKVVVSNWNKAAGNLANFLENWKEEELDKYLITHPILGRLTMREMMFFTIYHIRHHTNSVRKITEAVGQ